MSDKTYHMTEADVQKAESRTSKVHSGDIPAGSEAAMMQSIVDKNTRDKQDIIAERQANLPLPEDPPGTSDFNSADQRTVNVGSGEEPTGGFAYGADSLREPATGGSVARERGDETKRAVFGQGVGREGEEGLGGLPNDAVTQGKKDKIGLADTTNTDAAARKAAGEK